jgi:predicted amidohydrolase
MKVALIQTALIWEDPNGNRQHLDSLFQSLSPEIDLIVLPEMFTTGFTMTPASIDPKEGQITLNWMRDWSQKLDAGIVGSLVWSEEETYRNRLIFMMPDGNHQHYDKRHTFTLAGEDQIYERGKQAVMVHFRGVNFFPLICYDLRFPVWSRYSQPYDVLLYVANWPEPRISAWDILLKARAIENMACVIGVNRFGSDPNSNSYPGHSGVYDSLGKRLAYSEVEEVIYVTLKPEKIQETRSKLKFLNDRDSFNLQC